MKHGILSQAPEPINEIEKVYESVLLHGFSIVKNFLKPDEISQAREKIDEIYQIQLRQLGVENFDAIKDSNIARGLALEDDFFAKIAVGETAISFVQRFLGEKFILFSQNGIINPADQVHYQSSWHRDLNYQHWTSSKPLGISILIAVDPFTVETGCTSLAIATHKQSEAPSDWFLNEKSVPAVMNAGDAAIFDSMLFHKAGQNLSGKARRAINHIYTIPLIRPQFDFTKIEDFGGENYSSQQKYVLGEQINQPLDPYNWRYERLK